MISSFLDAMTGSFKSIKDEQIESVNRKIFGLGDYQNNNGQNKMERADLLKYSFTIIQYLRCLKEMIWSLLIKETYLMK